MRIRIAAGTPAIFSDTPMLKYVHSYSNRVDDLYAAWPAVMTINATYGRYILEPLMRFQNAGTGTPYAIPDLGLYKMYHQYKRNLNKLP